METLLDVAALLFGGLILYFGAEWLVKGSAGLAHSLGVRPLIIGLTVVAYGTSAPELAVSTAAMLDGSTAIVLGNVFGSNIANMALILGLTALISPPAVDGQLIRRELPVLCLATALVPIMLLGGQIHRIEAALLLLGAIGFTLYTLFSSSKSGRFDTEAGRGETAGDGVISGQAAALLVSALLATGCAGNKAKEGEENSAAAKQQTEAEAPEAAKKPDEAAPEAAKAAQASAALGAAAALTVLVRAPSCVASWAEDCMGLTLRQRANWSRRRKKSRG